MRVLIVGGGGREHALAWGISQSPDCEALFCAPGNAGTALLLAASGLGENLALGAEDVSGVLEASRRQRIDFVIVGPEAPLAAGMVDALAAAGIRAFGPTRAAAELESSKRFGKEMMRQAGVRHAAGAAFQEPGPAHAYIDATFASDPGGPPVIKADGLAAGKGVIVPCSLEAAHVAVDELLGGRFGSASATVVVEQRLAGLEASAMALVDGETVLPLPLSCDYKRARDGDAGPNTGGMGVYSPPGFLVPAAVSGIVESVHRPIARAMQAAGRPYQGLLYAGLMAPDEGQAPAVIEFNCRFGDPEAQVVLPQLRSGLLALLVSCAEGRLGDAHVEWSQEATVGVVLASGGYPGSYETGHVISGLEDVDADVQVFHAGTALDGAGHVVTSGGRVLTVVGRGPDLATARERTYANASRIDFAGRQYRTDIALRELDRPAGA